MTSPPPESKWIAVDCPICNQRFEGELLKLVYFPFCSKQCKRIDLGRWLDGTYSLDRESPFDPPDQEEEP